MYFKSFVSALLPLVFLFGMIQATVLPAAGFNVDTIDSSSTCTTSTPNIPNEPLSLPAPTDGSDWVIRFGDGHHTTDAAAACLSTLATPDYYWEVSSKNISYNTCTTISPILGNRLAARAAVWMSGNADLTSIEMFYESSSEPVCSEGRNTWCNQARKAGWYCLSNMYLVNSFSVSGT